MTRVKDYKYRNGRRNNISYISYSSNRNNFPKDSSRSIPQRYSYDGYLKDKIKEDVNWMLSNKDTVISFGALACGLLYTSGYFIRSIKY